MTLSEGISILVSAAALVLSLYGYIAGLNRERKHETIDAYNRLQSEVLDKLKDYSLKRMQEIADNSRKQEYKAEYKELGTLLARFDQFAVGVNTRVYDIKTLRRLAGSHIGHQYDLLKPLIEKRRVYSPGVYRELDKLVAAMPDKAWRKKAEKAAIKKKAAEGKPEDAGGTR